MQVLAILLGGSFLIMAGFIDDQFGLPPVFRLLVQLVAALLLVSTGIRIEVAVRRRLRQRYLGAHHRGLDHRPSPTPSTSSTGSTDWPAGSASSPP